MSTESIVSNNPWGTISEEGGLFGIWDHVDANQVALFALHALQHRGQGSTGIITKDDDNFYQHKALGLLAEGFDNSQTLNRLKGDCAIGHVRNADESDKTLRNVQPFVFYFQDETIGIAHNGNVTNALSLRKKLENEGAVFHSNSDAELLVHLIRHQKEPEFSQRLASALNELRGGFNFLLMTHDALYACVDRNCFRPFSIGKMANGSYALASETCALDAIGASFIRNIHAGQFVEINDDGYSLHQYTEDTQIAFEAMEYIYFARPDSTIAGMNVHSVRKRSGEILAQEQPCPEGDIVVGVPNSSLSASSGYAEASGLPYEMGLVKNQYVHRTFVEPTQALRDQGVKRKLSAVNGVVKGKSVVLIDDSIVRGTTMRRLVELLRKAGASQVHLRIASPPYRFPNYYGIDVNKSEELLAANHTVEEMREIFGADSLGFLSVDGLIESVGVDFDAPNKGLCVNSFTGEYPAKLCDYESYFVSQLTPIQKRILQGENVDE